MALVEVCVGSCYSALAAQMGGASRIELCDNLYEGGTTPSSGMIQVVLNELSLPVNVIIRPRGGDFLYTDLEFEVMKKDIELCKKLGVNGVVIGILTENGRIDQHRTRELIDCARPLEITFHRAFDMTPDPFEALDLLMDLGIDRVLSSGQKNSAPEGAPLIRKLIERAGSEIIILPGGGLNEENILEFARFTGALEFHATLRSRVSSKMVFRNQEVSMGGLPQIPEFDRKETDPAKVANFVRLIQSA